MTDPDRNRDDPPANDLPSSAARAHPACSTARWGRCCSASRPDRGRLSRRPIRRRRSRDLKGNHDLLCLTRPERGARRPRRLSRGRRRHRRDQLVQRHPASRRPSTALQDAVRDINVAAARVARAAADAASRLPTGRAIVAGVLGPTSRTASLSPSVEDPSFRNVNFDQLAAAYRRGGRWTDRRRRRHAADRDDLRHAQRQGGDLRHRAAVRHARLPGARS